MTATKTFTVAALLLATACGRDPVIEKVPDSAYTPPPTTAPASPTPTPKPTLRAQKPTPSCVNGWKEPAPGTALRTFPLDLLRQSQGLDKEFHVVDLRYFTGPDDANLAADSKQKTPVERWYGQVVYTGKPDFLIRFLVVRRKVGEGIAAIADYSTAGFASPDWYGFDGEGGKSTYPGLPGKWPGQPYDYVQAGELPPQVRGCLAPS
jgi:hypothetical protein